MKYNVLLVHPWSVASSTTVAGAHVAVAGTAWLPPGQLYNHPASRAHIPLQPRTPPRTPPREPPPNMLAALCTMPKQQTRTSFLKNPSPLLYTPHLLYFATPACLLRLSILTQLVNAPLSKEFFPVQFIHRVVSIPIIVKFLHTQPNIVTLQRIQY